MLAQSVAGLWNGHDIGPIKNTLKLSVGTIVIYVSGKSAGTAQSGHLPALTLNGAFSVASPVHGPCRRILDRSVVVRRFDRAAQKTHAQDYQPDFCAHG